MMHFLLKTLMRLNVQNGGAKARPWHFDIWLAPFRKTLEDTAPSPAVVPYFMEPAERISDSLKQAMFNRTASGPRA